MMSGFMPDSCYRSIPNGVLTAHDLGGLQCEVAS